MAVIGQHAPEDNSNLRRQGQDMSRTTKQTSGVVRLLRYQTFATRGKIDHILHANDPSRQTCRLKTRALEARKALVNAVQALAKNTQRPRGWAPSGFASRVPGRHARPSSFRLSIEIR
jgi:hypothetical protein